MNILKHKIDVTARLELTAREVELLECVTSYGTQWTESIWGKYDSVSYNGGVKKEEAISFLKKLSAAASEMKVSINESVKQGLVR